MNHSSRDTKYVQRCPLSAPRYRSYRTAFTLIELLIVVGILGILAAVTLPSIQGHIIGAKEAAAKDNLRILRDAIERYANDNNGTPPGYPDNNITSQPGFNFLFFQLVKDGHYIQMLPENPFNKLVTINVIVNSGSLPDASTGDFGWLYNPNTKEIRIDWPEKDSKGVRYFDY